MHQAIHAPRMHALRPDDLDEAAVRKEGYDRCFKQRIYELYQKNTEMPVEEVDRIVEGTNDLKNMYRDLCIRYGVVPGIPLWVPPPARPDWLPDFLLRRDDKKKVDAKEEDEESDGPPDDTFKPPAPKYKVQIRPAAKQASRPKGQPSMPARPPVPPKPPVMVPAPPPAPAPKPTDLSSRPVRVIEPKLLLGHNRPPAPPALPAVNRPPAPAVPPPPPPKPQQAPAPWWPPVPPPAQKARPKQPAQKRKACIYINIFIVYIICLECIHAMHLFHCFMHVCIAGTSATCPSSPWLETQTTGQVVCMHGVCSCIHSCTHAYMLKCGRLPNWKFWPQNGFCSAMHFLNRSCKNMFKSDLRRCRLRNTMWKMQW